MTKKIFLILIMSVLISSCGYKPIYYNENNKFEIIDISMQGVRSINNRIKNNLKSIQNTDADAKKFQIDIVSKKEKKITSKNSKGDIKSYSININVELLVKQKNTLIKKGNFKKSYNYSNINSKFDLTRNEKIITENLVDKITEEIILFIYSIKK